MTTQLAAYVRQWIKVYRQPKAMLALSKEHDAEERASILSHENILFERDCDIVAARAALAEQEKDDE